MAVVVAVQNPAKNLNLLILFRLKTPKLLPVQSFLSRHLKIPFRLPLKLTVKEQVAVIKVDKKNDGTFNVNGNLPATVKGSYARIAITADAQSNCKGAGGWLVKITE